MSEFWKPSEQGELYHYGVMGMKWGVHKARKLAAAGASPDHAVATLNRERYHRQIEAVNYKATRKLQKLNARYEKKQAKADRKFDKAERKANSLFTSKRSAEKAFKKASKAQFKANKAALKGKKWYEQMEKEYKKGGIPMSKDNIEIGKELVRQVRANARAMYAASYVRG